jgi:hypothetical protein
VERVPEIVAVAMAPGVPPSHTKIIVSPVRKSRFVSDTSLLPVAVLSTIDDGVIVLRYTFSDVTAALVVLTVM